MKHLWIGIIAHFLPALAGAQTEPGPYARIAILRPLAGRLVDFEAGYIRHLRWHREMRDPWIWYGWSIWAGERQRWFIYATFGHSAASLDTPVAPAEDERDNLLNVAPHVEYAGNALYEFLSDLSRGAGVPQARPRLEFMIVDLAPGAAPTFEEAMRAHLGSQRGETLWYRLMTGGPIPRYLRLRPLADLSAVLEHRVDQPLPESVRPLITNLSVELLTLRPTMSHGLQPIGRE